MVRVMDDVLSGNISPSQANAAVSAGGKLLDVVKMQYKYAKAAVPQDLRLLN